MAALLAATQMGRIRTIRPRTKDASGAVHLASQFQRGAWRGALSGEKEELEPAEAWSKLVRISDCHS